MYRYGFYFDSTYLLLIIGMVLTLLASSKMKRTYAAYQKVPADCGLSGAQTARRVLDAAGLTDVQILQVAGTLSDHYDPRSRTVSLSMDVYRRTTIAAICVAAHECGHAIQDQADYAPLRFRTSLVPVANFGSMASWPIFLAGLILSIRPLLTAGIVLFSLAVLFQLVTLPVEFNASSRALKMLEGTGILSEEENDGARKVLTAAALTYVAGLAASVLQLLRLMALAQGGRRRD